MLKLFIVDDESIIRKGLRFFIDWKKYNVEVIGEASNGYEALQSIVKIQPDIILTDIRMPKMDGLEFISEVKKILPDIKIIMLSGYNDTAYFTKAISFGVSEFILKSADSSEVISAVEKVAGQIFTERQKRTESRDISQLFDDNYQYLAARYMTDLVEGSNADVIKNNLADMKIEISGPYYCLIYIGNTQSREEQNAIMSTLHFCLSSLSPLVVCMDKTIICLLNCRDQHVDSLYYHKIINRLPAKHYPIIISGIFNDLSNISSLYDQSIEIQKRSCWYTDKKILFIPEVNLRVVTRIEMIKLEKEIITSLEKNSCVTAAEKLNNYFATLKCNAVPFEDMVKSMKRIVVCFCYYCNEYDNIDKYYQLIDQNYEAEKMFEVVFEMFNTLNVGKPQSAIVRKAIAIIEESYAEKLTLSFLAKKTFISISYLSKVFNEEVGIGVKQYINMVRVEKSKQLIQKDELKIFEIASAVGFRDYKQLATYFHRLENMSITEYRRTLM